MSLPLDIPLRMARHSPQVEVIVRNGISAKLHQSDCVFKITARSAQAFLPEIESFIVFCKPLDTSSDFGAITA